MKYERRTKLTTIPEDVITLSKEEHDQFLSFLAEALKREERDVALLEIGLTDNAGYGARFKVEVEQGKKFSPVKAQIALADYVAGYTDTNKTGCQFERMVEWLEGKGWTAPEASTIIDATISEGLLYESKPGFYRVVGENLDEAKKA